MSVPSPLIAGRYRLDVALASGGMGVVWRGWDERLERAVAIKQIRLQPGLSVAETAAARDRAMREARITARLHHPGAVPIYDVVEHDGQPCLIMQFLPSVSLQAVLAQRRTLPATEVARIGSELAAALAAAHRVGIVHRDVKPGNVLLADDGAAKLTDFGISHAMGDVSLTSTGMVTGTPAFLAPEVARGQSATFASDVFSLGATLYTATEGHPPVENDANAMAVLHRVASGELIPPRRSGPLTPLLLRMLDPDPSTRPGMDEAQSELTALHRQFSASASADPDPTTAVPARGGAAAGAGAESRTVMATRAVRLEQTAPRSHRIVLLLVVVGAVAVAALGVGLLYLRSRPNGNPTTGGGTSTPAATSGSKAHNNSTAPGKPTSRTASTTPTSRSTAPSSSGSASASASASVSPSASAASSAASASGSQSATTEPVSPSAASPTAGAVAPGSTNTQLAQATTAYYALVPGNLDAGWSRLTADYQSAHAGGFANYRKFWTAIRTVSTSNVVGQAPDSALATITYHYKTGQTVIERTRYRFVRSGGQWLISASSLLTHQTL